MGTTDADLSPPAFLRRVYSLAGADAFDGIGIHPYPYHPPFEETMWSRIDAAREVRDELGDRETPLWISEIGISTDPERGIPRRDQGRVLAKLYRSVEGHRVDSFIIHRLYDTGAEGGFWNQTGVVLESKIPKAAYCELGAAIGVPCLASDVAPEQSP